MILWTNVVLFIAKALEAYNYTGSVYLLGLVSLPLIIALLCGFNVEEKILTKRLLDMKDGKELEEKLKLLMYLIGKEKGEKNLRKKEILLRGYIRGHDLECNIPDCSLKIAKKLLDSNDVSDIHKNQVVLQNVINYISKRYNAGLAK